jgi:carbohydrate kinase (thermoresistant glucokinase family)
MFKNSRVIVVMGVAGCGKSTVGAALAARLHKHFLDADDYHPAANVEKMSHDIALTDADRWPWLDKLGAALKQHATGAGVVAACSALRRVYRERLIAAAGEPIHFVFLRGPKEVIAARMAECTDHFMPTQLIDSQFATLEEPAADENALVVDICPSVETLAEIIHQQLTDNGQR